MTTAYHPQTNGNCERFNAVIASMISMYVSTNQSDWDINLDAHAFSYNTSKHASTKITPFEVIYGREAIMPFQTPQTMGITNASNYVKNMQQQFINIKQLVKTAIKNTQDNMKTHYDKRRRDVTYKKGDKVMVFTPSRIKNRSTKLLHRYHGPYMITD